MISRSASRPNLSTLLGRITSGVSFRAMCLLTGSLVPIAAVAGVPGKTENHAVRHARTKPSHAGAIAAPVQRESIFVQAHRVVKGATEVLSHRQLEQQVPGTNPLKTLAQLPGVQFQSDDAQGIDTYSVQLYMHGFTQNEIGMTLEGIPLGEPTFRNYNGLNPLQAVSSENVERLDITQGAGTESTPSTNNLGGSINYIVSRPHEKTGGTIVQTFGSNAFTHSFFRFDTGRLNRTGTAAFVSYSRNDTDKWKGGGGQFFQQVNARVIQPIGEKSSLDAYFDWDQLSMVNYQDYTPQWLHENGYNIDNFIGTPNGWANAYRASQGIFPASYAKINDPKDASYYDSTVTSGDVFGGLTGTFVLNDRLTLKTTAYGHEETGHGTYANPYACTDPTASPCPAANDTIQLNGGRIFEQVRRPYIRRFGETSSLNYTLGHHELAIGQWFENNHYTSYAYAYQEPLPGEGAPLDPLGNFAGVPHRTLWGQQYNTNTFTAFVQDTWHPIASLSLHAGFKSLLNTTRVGDAVNWARRFPALASGVGLTTAKAFLPHVSADWQVSRHNELFVDIAENVHAYAQSGYNSSNSPFAVSQVAFDAVRDTLKPETAWNYAAGYRYTGSRVQLSLYGYHTQFSNRLQQILGSSGSGTLLTNNTATVANVGGVTINGVDAGLTVRLLPGLSLFNAFSYAHSVYDQDIQSGGVLYGTKGKQVVAYPRYSYKSRLSYDYAAFSAFIDAQYYGKRSFDYVDDYQIPSYWMSDLGVSYTFRDLGIGSIAPHAIHRLVVSFNIYNLSDTKYASTLGQNGFTMNNANNAAYENQSILLGAPRQFFGGIRAEF